MLAQGKDMNEQQVYTTCSPMTDFLVVTNKTLVSCLSDYPSNDL